MTPTPWLSGHPKIRAAQLKLRRDGPVVLSMGAQEAFEAMLKTLDEVSVRALQAHEQEVAEHRWARLGA